VSDEYSVFWVVGRVSARVSARVPVTRRISYG
jgi:hypothetical protein